MSIATHDTFMNRKLKEKFPPLIQQTTTLIQLFRGSITTLEAAISYTADVNASRKNAGIENKLWRVWILLQDVAVQFPDQHDTLVGMVRLISQLPDLDIGNEVVVKWSELPVLSWQWNEGVLNWGADVPLTKRVNGIRFTAKLSLLGIPGCDFITSSESDFLNAFEKSSDSAEGVLRSLGESVLLVREWVVVAGIAIYQCKLQTDLPNQELWIGKKEFSRQRWAFWKERTKLIAGQQKLSRAIRDAATEIEIKMEEVEMLEYA